MKIDYWDIPQSVIDKTGQAFTVGQHEVFVLWTASLNNTGPACEIKRCIVPSQRPGVTPFGVYVHIEGAELNRIQFDNYDRGEKCVIQLHTHPSPDVRMSELDREWEVVKHVGALSIIVPSYGKRGLSGFIGVNVYEREEKAWRLWSRNETDQHLRIIK